MLGVYLVIFPASMGLAATERANWFVQIIIVVAAVAANGALYVAISRAMRNYPSEHK
jgi:hypothetical protein